MGAGSSSKRYMLSVMCGRYTYKLTWEEIVRLYRLTLDQPPVNTRARYMAQRSAGRYRATALISSRIIPLLK